MGIHQGLNRLLAGVTRPLTPHEMIRGYVYISQDPTVGDSLGSPFEVDVNGIIIEAKRLDVSGRVHILRKYLEPVGPPRTVTIRLAAPKRLEIKVAHR